MTRKTWTDRVKRRWRGSCVFTTLIVMNEKKTKNYGGVCIVVGPRLVPYTQSVESNLIGRFLSITLRGQQDTETYIIVAYRPNPGYFLIGNETVWQ